jgi:SRSO17 transposase
MTEHEIKQIGPEFSKYLRTYRCCFLQQRSRTHFDNYCRGLLSDLPRKSVEPLALASGTAVRTLQEFLTTTQWDHPSAYDLHQQTILTHLEATAREALGRIGIFDETSCVKKGDKTPGVQRQWCGAVGKKENCIVTVHTAVVQGRFKALLDADLYLPQSWAENRKRCQEAGIPDEVGYRSKWRIALEQLTRLARHGLRLDWLTFDEGYGSKVPFLRSLHAAGQRYVAEVPKSFSVRTKWGKESQRADQVLVAEETDSWRRFRLTRQSVNDALWRAKSMQVWTAGRWHRLVVAINETTGEVKYFVSNAMQVGLLRLLQVAFTRWNVEHVFRVAKQETGLMHYEGRDYQGLTRHLVLGLIVMGFVSIQTARKREKKSASHDGTNLSSVERLLCESIASPPWNLDDERGERSDRLSSKAERTGSQVA